MQDMSGTAPAADSGETSSPGQPAPTSEVVSTHVLVPEGQAEKLRHLARKTRIAQSEYLREAVDDLLDKYGKAQRQDEG
jgi:Ribbon-helix-helix domain